MRDILSQRWLLTGGTYERENPKRIYYLSMEFLIGRSLANNVTNLLLDSIAKEVIKAKNLDWVGLLDQEPDAGLGNGGLGRLAACFLDSMATMQLPAMGYGLRYEYGMFRQTIQNGWQHEQPDNWLRRPDPWEVARPQDKVEVKLNCSFEMHGGSLRAVPGKPSRLIGIPFDRPVVGYGGNTINTLRLWSAARPISSTSRRLATAISSARWPKPWRPKLSRVSSIPMTPPAWGKDCGLSRSISWWPARLADLVRRFRRSNTDWDTLPEKVAIQLNDTHPSMAVPELMRILLDDAHLAWDHAWDLTQRTLAYTNHTLLPEALEKWPVPWFEMLLPRHLEIIFEINRRLLDSVRIRFPGDEGRVERVSLIEEGPTKHVRMANMAIVGSHSTNGVAAIHSELLRTVTVKDLAEMFPERFSNKTNGVTPRRWLLLANPALARTITEAIGDDWITDLSSIEQAQAVGRRQRPFAATSARPNARPNHSSPIGLRRLRDRAWIRTPSSIARSSASTSTSGSCSTRCASSCFTTACGKIRTSTSSPRTFFFAGKAAPAYHLAKVIIKFINNLAATIDADPAMRGRINIVFLPEYCATLAERLIPASDVSNQISTAGYEASGTSNMKFMMNGALTIGTRDGATIEMAEEAGEENFFLFGLTAEQVADSRGWYDPRWHYEHDPETRAALDLIFADHFNRDEPGIFTPLRDALLTSGDHYMHLADLNSYLEADQRLVELYANAGRLGEQGGLECGRIGKVLQRPHHRRIRVLHLECGALPGVLAKPS